MRSATAPGCALTSSSTTPAGRAPPGGDVMAKKPAWASDGASWAWRYCPGRLCSAASCAPTSSSITCSPRASRLLDSTVARWRGVLWWCSSAGGAEVAMARLCHILRCDACPAELQWCRRHGLQGRSRCRAEPCWVRKL